MTKISAIICTHNPRDYSLRRVFDSLKAQTLPKSEWELLLVDNRSEKNLSDIWDLSWHPEARHLRENEIGLTAARICGIREATGGLLVFIDDDNILAPDFLQQALEIADRCPYLGVFGAGRLEPEFETQPAPELTPHLSMLALRSVPGELWSNNPQDTFCYPWGAGLCVTPETANRFVQLVGKLNIQSVLGRRGKQLFCGEDDLFSWAAAGVGKGFGIFPGLRITHLIFSGRVEKNYFLRLIHDQQFSQAVLAYLLTGVEKSPRLNVIQALRIGLHGISKGMFAMRFEWASNRGRRLSGRFIRENRLRPIDFRGALGDVAEAKLS